MSATQTEIRGLVNKEIEVLRQKRVVLEKAGLHVDQLEQTLTDQLGDTVAEDARQDFLKAEGLKATVRTKAAYEALYETGSGILDAIMGVLGKGSEESKVLQRIRSRIRQPGEQSEDAEPGGTLPVEPAPTK